MDDVIARTFMSPGSLRRTVAGKAHLASLGLSLDGKTVYEPGCGIGLYTDFFEEKDCEVYSTDISQQNVDYNLDRHPWRRVVQADVSELPPWPRTFDIVFAYGLLYHVLDPRAVLEQMAQVCDDLLLLSTLVNWEDDGELRPATQWAGADQGLAGVAYRPSRNWLMRKLGVYFPYVYTPRTQPDHDQYPTRWPTRKDYWQRAVFVASRHELDEVVFSPVLLMEQEKHGD